MTDLIKAGARRAVRMTGYALAAIGGLLIAWGEGK